MSQNIIVMNRGNSNLIKINVSSGLCDLGFNPTPYSLSLEGDTIDIDNTDDIFNIYFGVMLPHQKFEDAIIRKKYSLSDCDKCYNLYIQLNPEDTINLDPGTYYYAVKMRVKGLTENDPDQVITLINKTKFFLND